MFLFHEKGLAGKIQFVGHPKIVYFAEMHNRVDSIADQWINVIIRISHRSQIDNTIYLTLPGKSASFCWTSSRSVR